MAQDLISDTLNQIMNAKKAKKQEIEVKRYSKFLIEILKIAKERGYLEYTLDEKNKKLKIKIKDVLVCKTIKPRFYSTVQELDKYMRRFLPARGFGIILVSTSMGLITHEEALEKNTGGSLVAVFY